MWLASTWRIPVKVIILTATVVAFAAGPAFADGNGCTIFGFDPKSGSWVIAG